MNFLQWVCRFQAIGARVKRSGITYTADLITAEIKNAKTLSQLIAADHIEKNVWEAIGRCLRLFEEKRIYHPDLNTNNILIDESLEVLIDFDVASRLHEKIGSSNKTQSFS